MFEHQDSLKSLRKFDLNLLTVFEAVYFYKSVSKAADILGMTSPAVSQSIQRLRQYFPDPLFIRDGKGISATVFADSMHENIKGSLNGIIDIFADKGDSIRNLVIWSDPHLAQLLIPDVCSHLMSSAKIKCRIAHNLLPEDPIEVEHALLYHKADIIFDIVPIYNSAIESELIYSEDIVMVCGKNHPRISGDVATGNIKDERYTTITKNRKKITEFRTKIDTLLGSKRTVSFASPSLITALAVIEKTNDVGFFPESMYEKFKDIYHLKRLDCEVDLGTYEIYMSYSKKAQQDKALLYLINKVKEVLITNSTVVHR